MRVELVYRKKSNILVIDSSGFPELMEYNSKCTGNFGSISVKDKTILYCRCKQNTTLKPEFYEGKSDEKFLTASSGIVYILDEPTVDLITDFFPEEGVFIKNFIGEISFDDNGDVVGDMTLLAVK